MRRFEDNVYVASRMRFSTSVRAKIAQSSQMKFRATLLFETL